MSIDAVLAEIESTRAASLESLKAMLRIPSISAQPDHAGDCRACAGWIADCLRGCGFSPEIAETGGHPVVLAKNQFKPGRPTVLLYGHYDVQPPEPLDLWTTPPFEPTVRDGSIYARGACDDKGQVWAHLHALQVWARHGGVPVNLIVLIEGEEEIGSENLERFIQSRKADLAADVAVISDTGQFARGVPAITYGLRGLVYEEIFLTGAGHDLHSGLFGGAVPNPANILTEVLGRLHDRQSHKVLIPGFYDDVAELTEAERKEWQSLPFDEQGFLTELKLPGGHGEAGYSTIERKSARPTCDINGLTAGYQGHGAKTVIGSTASAKVSMRLVPNQDPVKIQTAFREFIRSRVPAGVKLELKNHGLAGPVIVSRDSDAMRRATDAMEQGFGKRPVLIRDGGSIPIVGLFKRELGLDTLLLGFGLPDDRIHSPNEKFGLDCLHQGTRTAAALWAHLAR